MGYGAQLDRISRVRTRVAVLDGVSLPSPSQLVLSTGEKGDGPRLGRRSRERIAVGAATFSERAARVGQTASARSRRVAAPAATCCIERSREPASARAAQIVIIVRSAPLKMS